jgi:hypothetical protein
MTLFKLAAPAGDSKWLCENENLSALLPKNAAKALWQYIEIDSPFLCLNGSHSVGIDAGLTALILRMAGIHFIRKEQVYLQSLC